MACWMIQSSCWNSDGGKRLQAGVIDDERHGEPPDGEIGGRTPWEGKPSWGTEQGASITAAAVIVRGQDARRTGSGQRSGCAVAFKTGATWACRRRRRQAFPMWVNPAAGSPAASMSMADSKASPSIGPCSRIAWPVWRSCSRSDGVAVTPPLVASAAWRESPRRAARSPCTVRWLASGRGSAGPRASPGRRCACGHRPIRWPARRPHARRLRRRTRPGVLRRTRPARARPAAGGAIAGHVRVAGHPALELQGNTPGRTGIRGRHRASA
jgi:hypothetical protein